MFKTKKLFGKRRGQAAFIWITALVTILFVGLLYITLSSAHEKVSDSLKPDLSGDYLETFNRIENYWFLWPLIFIPAVIIWMYVKSIFDQQSGIQ